jgi:hypothetical protein
LEEVAVTFFRLSAQILVTSILVSGAFGCHHSDSGDDPYTPARIAKIKPALHFKSVVIHPFTVAKTVEDPGDAPTDCHDATIAYLSQKNLFDSVLADNAANPPGSLIVDANIEDMRIVSGGARFWAGAMAGKSFMNVKIVARDAASGQIVGSTVITSDNNEFGAAWSFGASDRGLPSDMGPVLADFIINTAQAAHPVAASDPAAPPAAPAPAQ